MWLPACLPDVTSDMSAFHRVDDVAVMPGPRFFSLAWRLPHYRGAMRDRVITQQRDRDDTAPPPAARPAAQRSAPAVQPGPVTEAVLSDPVMGTLFSFA